MTLDDIDLFKKQWTDSVRYGAKAGKFGFIPGITELKLRQAVFRIRCGE